MSTVDTESGRLRRAVKKVGAFLFKKAPPSEIAPWWDAGGNLLSIFFWLTVAVSVGALFRQKFLPFVDYPQHLSLAAILNRMARSGSTERVLYDTNIASFNSMFHVVVALYRFVMPIERAGEAGVGTSFVLMAVGMLQLLKVTGRARVRAFLVIPLFVPVSLAWGFCNFCMSLAVQMIVLSRVIQASRVMPERRLRFDLLTALLALLGMWAQMLGSMVVYELMLVAILVEAESFDAPLFRRIARAFHLGLPLVPALIYLYWSYRVQPGMDKTQMGLDGKLDDIFGWEKTTHFFEKVNSMRPDHRDRDILAVGGAALLLSGFFRDRKDRPPPVTRWLMPAAFLLYMLLPMRMWGTWYVYPRIAVSVAMMFVLFVPQPRRAQHLFSLAFVAVGIAWTASFYQVMGTYRDDLDDFDRILEEAPKGRRVAGLIFDPNLSTYYAPGFMHFPAYYVARNGGEVAFSFTTILSLPVHYKRTTKPPGVPGRIEWEPRNWKPDMPYSKYFDLMLIRSGKPGEDPRERIFGAAVAPTIPVLSHHGRWWILETRK